MNLLKGHNSAHNSPQKFSLHNSFRHSQYIFILFSNFNSRRWILDVVSNLYILKWKTSFKSEALFSYPWEFNILVVLSNAEFYMLRGKVLHIICIGMGEKSVPKMEYIILKQTFEFSMLILA